jgi:hypothetical protein
MKINESAKKESTFNLINVQPLFEKTKEIAENEKIIKADDEFWEWMAMNKAERIAELLQEDMPFACVERFGKSNGHYDMPSICIQREKGISAHHEEWVRIDVVIEYESAKLSHNCYYSKGISLCYKTDGSNEYKTIEELFEKSNINEMIRERIINWIK